MAETLISERGISITLNVDESIRLLAFLMHAKFGDGPKSDIYLNPTINDLIAGLIEAGRSERIDSVWFNDRDFSLSRDEIGEFPTLNEIMSNIMRRFEGDELADMMNRAFFPYRLR